MWRGIMPQVPKIYNPAEFSEPKYAILAQHTKTNLTKIALGPLEPKKGRGSLRGPPLQMKKFQSGTLPSLTTHLLSEKFHFILLFYYLFYKREGFQKKVRISQKYSKCQTPPI